MKFCSSGKVDEQFFCQKNIYAQKSKQHAIEQPLLLLLLLKKTPIQQKIWSVASTLLEVYLEFWLTNLWFSFSEKDLLLSACFSFYLAYLFWFNLTISIIFFPTAWIGNWNGYWSTIYSDFLTFWGIQKSDIKTVSIT